MMKLPIACLRFLKSYYFPLSVATILALCVLTAYSSSSGVKDAQLATPSILRSYADAQTSVPQTSTSLATTSSTSVPETGTVPPTPFPTYPPLAAGTKEAAATLVAQNYNKLGTEVALTHAPTETPGEPPPMPSETPIMGLTNACPGTTGERPICLNEWREVQNGKIVEVQAGWNPVDGRASLEQGVVMVYIWGVQPLEVYNTPQQVGPVRIVSVDTGGTLFTVAPVNLETPVALLTPWATQTPGVTFVFDLTTRQWLDPAGTPIPTTPVPTSTFLH